MKYVLISILVIIKTTLLLAQNPINEYYKGENDKEYYFYYPNGQLELNYTIEEGNLQGRYLSYYKSGQLQNDILFKNGYFDGHSLDIIKMEILYCLKYIEVTLYYFLKATSIIRMVK